MTTVKSSDNFSLRDVATSALGLSAALAWTETIKGGMKRDDIIYAIKVTIIVAIIAIILHHMHIFAKKIKDEFSDHPITTLNALATIW
jgi:hypothetical protein